jgi:hypothetical protein
MHLIFIYVLRAYLERQNAQYPGWLAGLASARIARRFAPCTPSPPDNGQSTSSQTLLASLSPHGQPIWAARMPGQLATS